MFSDINAEDKAWLPKGFEFLCGVPQPKRDRTLLLNLKAYIDESGVQGTTEYFVLAGFIGQAISWANFSSDWERCLAAEPSIPLLKTSDAARLTNAFYGWSAEARDRKLSALIDVIKKYPFNSVYAAIHIPSFKLAWECLLPPKLRNSYFIGSYALIAAIGYELIDAQVNEQIDVIFDNHDIFKNRIREWYPIIRKGWQQEVEPRFARLLPPDVQFMDDTKYVPLQAADMLAWILRTAFSEEYTEFLWMGRQLSSAIPMSMRSTFVCVEIKPPADSTFPKGMYSAEQIKAWVDRLAYHVSEPDDD